MTIIAKYIFIVPFLLISFLGMSTEVQWTFRLEGEDINDGFIEVEDGDYYELNAGLFNDLNALSYLRLGLQERIGMGVPNLVSGGEIKVKVKVYLYDNLGAIVGTQEEILNLVYDYTNSTGLNIDAADFRMLGVHRFTAEVEWVEVDGVMDAIAPEYVYLEGGFNAERYYAFDADFKPSAVAQLIEYDDDGSFLSSTAGSTNLSTVQTTDELYVSWEYVEGAELYELEWTWIDNYSETSLSTVIAASQLLFSEQDFKLNSTRIRTGNQYYRIPQIFSKGYLVYRVRGIGRWMDEPTKEKYGKWSSYTPYAKNDVADWPNIITINFEHDGRKNWQYQATYAEEGKKKEVTQYFDGSLRSRQTVTRINSTNQSIVGETVYDNEGRGVIQVLPVPQANPGIHYYPSATRSGNTELPYTHVEFDWEDETLGGCEIGANELHPDHGAGNYYSSAGHITDEDWQKYVPESNGYAFTQVEYTPDNTGRIRRQSGVGDTHKLGSGKETVYYYMQPQQEELNRLFGYKVGFMSRYKKNMVVDANGQVSVSYLDAQGRVIATAMAGDNLTDFESLASEELGENYHHLTSVDLLNQSPGITVDTPDDNNDLYSTGVFGPINDGLKYSTQFGVPMAGDHDFVYTVETSSYEETCTEGSVSYPYIYDLKLTMRNDCGEDVFEHEYINIEIGNVSLLTSSFSENISDIELASGTYTLLKELKVNEQALLNYTSLYLSEANACLPDLEESFGFTLVEDCGFSDCQECVDSLGTVEDFLIQAALDNYVETLTSGQELYYSNLHAELLLECEAPCEALSTCHVVRQMMLGDMMPGNQYASTGAFNESTQTYAASTDPTSIFYTDNKWLSPSTTYLNDQGQPVSFSNTDADRSSFIQNFREEWAEALLVHHPEYALLEYVDAICNEEYEIPSSESLSSEAFDSYLRNNIQTYDDAVSNDLGINFITQGIYAVDPYFNLDYSVHIFTHSTGTFPSHDDKEDLMEYALGVNYNGSGLNLFQTAAKSVRCAANLGLCTVPTDWSDMSLTAEEKDLIWQTYKGFYLSFKGNINQYLMDMFGFQDGIYNGCIGNNNSGFGGAQAFQYILVNPAGATYQSIMNKQFLLWDLPTNAPIAFCDPVYDNKIIRVGRMDGLSNSGLPAQQQAEQLEDEADYGVWEATGLCPETFDMQYLLSELLVGETALATSWEMSSLNFLTWDIFEAISNGVTPITNSNMVISHSVDGSGNLVLSFQRYENGILTGTAETISIAPFSGFSWTNLGTGWYIYSLSNSYPVTGANQVQFLISAGTPSNPTQEFVVTYTSSVSLNSCQEETNPDNYLVNNSNSPNCEQQEEFEAALLALAQSLALAGTINTDFALDAHPLFNGSVLEDYFGNTADWLGDSGNTEIEGNLFTLDLGMSLASATYISSISFYNGMIYIGYTTGSGSGVTNVDPSADNYAYTITSSGLPADIDFSCPCIVAGNPIPNFLASLEDLMNYVLGTPVILDGATPAELLAMEPFTPPGYVLGIWGHDDWYNEPDPGLSTLYISYNSSIPAYGILLLDTYAGGYRIESVSDLSIDYITNGTRSYSCIAHLENDTQIGITGRINLLLEECGSEACIPVASPPISCTETYEIYEDAMALVNDDYSGDDLSAFNEFYVLSETDFCAGSFAYIASAYLEYITELGVDAITHPLYLSISNFGNTSLGYSNTALQAALESYEPSDFSDIEHALFTPWNEFVNDIYLPTLGVYCPPIFPSSPFPQGNFPDPDPCAWINNTNSINSVNQQEIYLDQLGIEFQQAYIEGAMSSVEETFRVSYVDKEYHYTLYYYDRAGNLMQTVPPKGVKRLEYDASGVPVQPDPLEDLLGASHADINTLRLSSPLAEDLENPLNTAQFAAPEHTHQTIYRYNTLNQLVYQKTPDGGESRFAYDGLGRLILSQNAKQKQANQYSYTRYDELGRVTEVGELTKTGHDINEMGRLVNSSQVEQNSIVNSFNFPNNFSTVREEVTRTFYDNLPTSLAVTTLNATGNPVSATITGLFGPSYAWDNTRNRILGVVYIETLASNPESSANYANGTFYDYDVHGNVKHLIQINKDALLTAKNQHIKHVEYDYDLVSGNVNKVIYQRGQQDQFMHRYVYDDDNRITITETSKDGFYWEKDAKYFYYDHGPLARTELGDKKAQALDYAYTIQGWLKTVNGEEVDENTMMGQDGKLTTLNSQNGRDVFGYSLSYYDNDYESAEIAMLNYSESGTPNLTESLYNGNIRSMHTALSDQDEQQLVTHQTNYGYDQLNRIESMTGYNRTGVSTPILSGYSSSYSYDENGNLQTLQRFAQNGGSSIAMDDFAYHYSTGNNQLEHVSDAITTTSGLLLGDIQLGQFSLLDAGGANYQYDAIGQLIKDRQENIENIEWTVTNKVKEVEKTDGTLIRFDYDAMGNRIAKHVINDDDKQSTYYALDAQGNVMNVYTYNNEINENLYLSERNIYGSSRLGQEQTHIKMDKTSNGNYLMFENPVSGSLCVTPGHLYFESAGTTHSYLDYDNDGDLDIQATNPSSAWSVQVTLAVIPGQTFTVNYDVLQISGGQLEPNPRRCDTGASAPGSYAVTTPGSYSMSVAVPANGPSMYRFKWYSYAGVSYTLGNISVTGADFNAFGTAGSNPSSEGLYANEFGDKRYELSNHLGNVLEVVTDRKIPVEGTGGSAGTVDFYTADVVSYSDYYPFGSLLPGRHGGDDSYRYGYNEMESDKEIKNSAGTSYTTYFRQLDPRVGRWFSIDPVHKSDQSPYVSMSNNPIIMVDPKGDDDYYNEKGEYLYTDTKITKAVRIIPQERWNKIRYDYNLFPWYIEDRMSSNGNLINELNQNSAVAFERDKLYGVLKEWGDTYTPSSENQEYAMGIFQLEIETSSGESKKVYMTGNTVTDKERSTVDQDKSVLTIGGMQMVGNEWTQHFGGSYMYRQHGEIDRFAVVHTHPTGYASKEISNEDKSFSINRDVIIYMFSYESKSLFKYDPIKSNETEIKNVLK